MRIFSIVSVVVFLMGWSPGHGVAAPQAAPTAPATLNYRVIRPEIPSAVEKLAAAELETFLAKAFTRPLMLDGTDEPVTFYVGYSPAAGQAGFSRPTFSDGEFMVARNGRAILAAGYDDAGSPLVWSNAAGTLSAVYYLLDRYLGFEFYFPTDAGVAVPRNPPMLLKEGEDRPHPSFAVRGFSCDGDGVSHEDGLLFQRRLLCAAPAWMRNTQSYTFANWKDRFWTTHPEYFAEAGGEKVFHQWLNSNPCFSSEAAVRQVAEDVVGRFAGNPGLSCVTLFDDIPYCPCLCARCVASEARRRGGEAAISEEYFGFVAKVAEQVLAKDPDRKLLAHTKEYRWPPKRVTLDPRVAIHLLAARPEIYDPARLADILLQVQAWHDNGNPIVLRSYERMPHFKNYPLINPLHTVKFARAMHGLALGFSSSDSAPGIPYAYSALNNYVQGKILFDVHADEKQLIQQFVAYCFPGAETEMELFYALMEQLWAAKKDFHYDALADSYAVTHLEQPLALLRAAEPKLRSGAILFPPLKKAFEAFYTLAQEKTPYYAARAPKDVRPPTAPGAVTLDGTLDDSEWRGAMEFELMPIKWDPTGGTPQPGKVRVMRDRDHLYLGMIAYDTDINSLTRLCTRNNEGNVWQDDSFEIMIAPGPELSPYYQLIINSLGVWMQLENTYPDRVSNPTEKLKFTTAAKVFPNRYEIELVLPLAQFGSDALTHPWHFNIFRNRMCLPLDYVYADLIRTQWSGISVMGESFHMVSTYNRLIWE